MLWHNISKFILKNRLALLLSLIAVTAVMGFYAKDVQLTYGVSNIIPVDDPVYKQYVDFKSNFGDEGNVMVIGVQTRRIFKKDFFNGWYQMGEELKEIEGVKDVVSIAHIFNLQKNKEEKIFEIEPIITGQMKSQDQVDSIRKLLLSLPFYRMLVFNPETNTSLMAVTLHKKDVNSKKRIKLVKKVIDRADEFGAANKTEIHYSGLPFLRTLRATKIADELKLFLIMAMIITIVLLSLLFRSFSAVFFPMIVVVIGVVWSLGLIVIFGYKITLLTGLIPSLVVVIGIPNCVYLLNKYHSEFRKHTNKIKSLSRVIEKIGHVTFYANLTTAIGFAVFYFTRSKMLEEFGAVAGISLASLFVISLIVIPVVFSYLPNPNTRTTNHLDSKMINAMLDFFHSLAINHRKGVYIVTLLVCAVALYGLTNLRANGYIFDDIPQHSKEYKDLKFFEDNFNGVMPFEILVDTKKKGATNQLKHLKKLDEVQMLFDQSPIFSKPMSIVDGLKFSTQAFFKGKKSYYRLPNNMERGFVISYLSRMKDEKNLAETFTDSTKQIARISVQVADIGSEAMPLMMDSLRTELETVLDTSAYNFAFTGASVVAMEGYNYLVRGLLNSLALAFILIALIMAYLFRSVKMLAISLIPNIIPLMITAAIMGYSGISLKPSTVLIFSIAFGISVDFTIHFLAKYRQEYERHNWNISKTLAISMRETGVSMIYTALTLFSGFIIFTASEFGGTINLGILTSITIVVSVFANLIVLPALLLAFENQMGRRAIRKETLIDVYNEEEDIELERLNVK
jgi:predicted RND superfamily exporter protein